MRLLVARWTGHRREWDLAIFELLKISFHILEDGITSSSTATFSCIAISWCQKITELRLPNFFFFFLRKLKKKKTGSNHIVYSFSALSNQWITLFNGKQLQERSELHPQVFVLLYCTILAACMVHVANNTDRPGDSKKDTQKEREKKNPTGLCIHSCWGEG